MCTVSTPNHIAWSLPILPPSYYLPSGSLHFYFFFLPTMIMANWSAKLSMVGAFFMGPVFTQILAARHMDTYSWEWPATWCYMSVAQCAIALAVEFVVAVWSEKKFVETSETKPHKAHDAVVAAVNAGFGSDARAVVSARTIHAKCN